MSADRIVPNMDNSTIPISRIDELHEHLAAIASNPETPIDARLFDEVELQLTEHNIPPLLPTVLVPLTQILKTTTQDPTPLLSMTIKLLAPLPFSRVLALADEASILSALTSPLPGANLLALAILHKASHSAADAAILSTLPNLFEALVTRWLDAQDVGVGERAARVLGDLLETDCDAVAPPGQVPSSTLGNGAIEIIKPQRQPGHGRLWHMLFGNESVFAIIPVLCSGASSSLGAAAAAAGVPRTERQISLSQGRLLRLLPRLATLDLHAIAHTAFADLIPLPQTLARATGQGLLQWATLAMVDKSDLLMHLSLVDFFETFVSIMRVAGSGGSGQSSTSSGRDLARSLVKAATANDEQLKEALLGLPDRTVEEESEPLRIFIEQLFN